MEDILINREAKICLYCNFQAKTAEVRCPRCRKELKTEFEVQKKAVICVLLGAIEVFVGLVLLAKFNPFSAHLDMETLLFVLFNVGLFLVVGAASLIGGLWQYLTGRDGETMAKIIGYCGAAGIGMAAIYLFIF